jgi:hypothetical protein
MVDWLRMSGLDMVWSRTLDEGACSPLPPQHPPRTACSLPLLQPPANPRPQRNLPSRGLFRPGPLIAGGAALMLFGWYKLIVGIREQKCAGPPFPLFCPLHRSVC